MLSIPSVRDQVLTPLAFDSSILVTNLITGILIARVLGPAGRGEIAAILLITQTLVWVFSGGANEAVTFRLARNPGDGARLFGTWAAIAVPLAVLAITVTELALPVLFSAQTQEALEMARFYAPIIVLMMLQSVLYGMLLGDHDFLLYNLVRIIQPGVVAIFYLAAWLAGSLTVELALIINAVAIGSAFAVSVLRVLARQGLGRPSREMLRDTLSFGLRAHMGSIAGLVNARLDLFIIPAFLAAASVGLYSVATNVTSIIGTLTATIATIVLPVATRQSKQSARTVIRMLQIVVVIGLAIALPLSLVADTLVTFIYGANFEGAATPLRILLPGVVLDAAAMVLWSGLLAANRPFLSSIAAFPAAVLTVGGLVLFLESGGIDAAAIVTTTAYTLVFVISAVLYKRVAQLRWRDFLSAPARQSDPRAHI